MTVMVAMAVHALSLVTKANLPAATAVFVRVLMMVQQVKPVAKADLGRAHAVSNYVTLNGETILAI